MLLHHSYRAVPPYLLVEERRDWGKSLTITTHLLLYVLSGLTLQSSTLCPHIVLMFLYRSHNKQQLFYYTELSDWFL